jgi:hypothetical protein
MLNRINKKAEVGEILTWVVVTPFVLAVLILFILSSSLLFKIKSVNIGDVQTDILEESPVLTVKTNLAYEITGEKNKDIIEDILEAWNEND